MLRCQTNLGSPFLIEGNLTSKNGMHDVCRPVDPSDWLDHCPEEYDARRSNTSYFVKGQGGATWTGRAVVNNEYVVFQPWQVWPRYVTLDRNPIAGANAAPVDGNILVWHANFPADYPVAPPHAFFVTDSKGRTAVCLDLFGNFKQIHTEWGKDGQASGWSSSYDVSTILVNMQAMLCSD
eukprot:gene30988-28951_t